MADLLVDTHAVIWFLLQSAELSPGALTAIGSAFRDGDAVHLSSVSLVEMVYLTEKSKIPEDALDRLLRLQHETGCFAMAPLDNQIALRTRDIPRAQVPDMPDRIIAATALHLEVPLVTRDARIRAADPETIW